MIVGPFFKIINMENKTGERILVGLMIFGALAFIGMGVSLGSWIPFLMAGVYILGAYLVIKT